MPALAILEFLKKIVATRNNSTIVLLIQSIICLVNLFIGGEMVGKIK